MPQRFIMTASSKGGIGKSTVALGISLALCKRGLKVLLADLDFGNPCLDMMTGTQDDNLYTLTDAAEGRCPAEAALTAAGGVDGLYILPSSLSEPYADSLTAAKESMAGSIAAAVGRAAQAVGADFVIIDTGAGINIGVEAASKVADCALVVAGHSPVSVRSAESTAMRLRDNGVGDIRLVINSFDADGTRKKDGRDGIITIMDRSRLPLCGVIPYDERLTVYNEKTNLRAWTSDRFPAAAAFDNIAARLTGANVPLFHGAKKLRRRRVSFYK